MRYFLSPSKYNLYTGSAKDKSREFSVIMIHSDTIFYRHTLEYDIATMYQLSIHKTFYSWQRNIFFNIDTFYKWWNND